MEKVILCLVHWCLWLFICLFIYGLFICLQENGMMAAEVEQTGAINLTTSKEEHSAAASSTAVASSSSSAAATATVTNGDVSTADVSTDSQDNSHNSPANNVSFTALWYVFWVPASI